STLKLSIILDYCSRALKKRKYPFQDTKPFNLPCQVRREEGKEMREILILSVGFNLCSPSS
ncbi:MAG: hypothetical protein RXQ94_09060, partial [Caldivirga sp.]